MARTRKKAEYKGPKLAGDNTQTRHAVDARRALQNAKGSTTNEVFAAIDGEFKAACERAKIKPTGRQASKYRRGFGTAYKFRNATKEVAA